MNAFALFPHLLCVSLGRSEEILYVQLDSRLSQGQLREALEGGIAACRELRVLFEGAVKQHMTH